jgi:C2H2-type zinc finger
VIEEEVAVTFDHKDEDDSFQVKVEKIYEAEELQVEALDEILEDVINVKRKPTAHKFTKPKSPETWQCSECNKYFQSRTLLRNHVKNEHKSSETTLKKSRKMCQLCGLSFATNGWYHHMLRAHTADPRFVCDFCGKG